MATQKTITLGGGCFWCLEAIYQDVIGVEKLVSGYAGGLTENPGYREICTGTTGHAEVIQINFNSDVISLEELLAVFWHIHDPTTLNQQGNDVGTQYRSVIFYHDEEQRGVAERSKTAVSPLFPTPIVTEITPVPTFYPAEKYHQNYYNDNGNQPYCRVVIAPKVAEWRSSCVVKFTTLQPRNSATQENL